MLAERLPLIRFTALFIVAVFEFIPPWLISEKILMSTVSLPNAVLL